MGHCDAKRNGQHVFVKTLIAESSFFQCFESIFHFKFCLKYFLLKNLHVKVGLNLHNAVDI